MLALYVKDNKVRTRDLHAFQRLHSKWDAHEMYISFYLFFTMMFLLFFCAF